MAFWNGVRKEIAYQNTTQEWVASRAHIDHGTFRSAISKNQDLRLSRALRIAAALGTTVEALDKEEVSGLKIRDNRHIDYAAESTPNYHGSASDSALLRMARHYQSLIEDLEILAPEVREQFLSMVHGAAEFARAKAKHA